MAEMEAGFQHYHITVSEGLEVDEIVGSVTPRNNNLHYHITVSEGLEVDEIVGSVTPRNNNLHYHITVSEGLEVDEIVGSVTPRNNNLAVVVDRTMYISGQIGLDPDKKALVDGGVVPQTEQALKNMGAILEAAGVSYKNVVKTTVLLADINDFHPVNDVYVKYFTEYKPARAAYQAAALPLGARVEIEAIAVLGDITEAS